jgi:Icc-related predicted phosphoesterase
MKLLLTADLHFRLHWFRWLIEQAPDFDLVCIAGDLLDYVQVRNPDRAIW